MIDEIVVTAQKRSESVQDVPVSVSAFAEQQLTRVHATQLQDYAAYMPGINISNGGSPGQTSITLRGIAPVGPGSVVGTYVDDTPLGASSNYARATSFALDLMPYDIERVEVLRGPQGTLYGAGSMGGLLKYVLKEPNTDALEFRVGVEGSDVSGADDLGWGARAAVNVPLSDSVAVRASYFQQNTPGYIDNVYTGREGCERARAERWPPRAEVADQRERVVETRRHVAAPGLGQQWRDGAGVDQRRSVPCARTASAILLPRFRSRSRSSRTWTTIRRRSTGTWAGASSSPPPAIRDAHLANAGRDHHLRRVAFHPSVILELPGAPYDQGLARFNITLDHEKWTQEIPARLQR